MFRNQLTNLRSQPVRFKFWCRLHVVAQFLMIACAVDLTCISVVAQDASTQSARFDELSIGHDGIGRVGAWLPVRSVVSGLPNGATVRLAVTAPDARSNYCRTIVDENTVDSDGAVSLSGFVRVGRLDATIHCDVVAAEEDSVDEYCSRIINCREADIASVDNISESVENLQRQLFLWRQDVQFLLTVGEPAGIPELLRNAIVVADDAPLITGVQVDSIGDLPEERFGLNGIDILVLNDNFELNDRQFDALQFWLRSGGHLVVSSGKSVENLLGTQLGHWLQSQFEIQQTSVEALDLSAMQSLVPGGSRLETNRRSVKMSVSSSEQPRVLAETINGPLVSRKSYGAGQVTFVAVDLNQNPVSRWISLPQLYEVLILGQTLKASAADDSRGARISSTGVTDLSSQMMAAIDSGLDIDRWSTWSVMAFAFVFLLLIGPLDYVLVTLLLKRPHLTWVTFPLFVVGGCVVALTMKNDSSGLYSVSQCHVIDIDQDSGTQHVNVRSWMSLSASTSGRSNLTTTPQLPFNSDSTTVDSSILTWSGRSEDVYGGLYRKGGIGLGRQHYEHSLLTQSDATTLKSTPFLVNGSTELFSQWTTKQSDVLIDSQLGVSGVGLLQGQLTHQLSGDVEDWILVYGRRVYRPIGTRTNSLSPGESVSMQDEEIIASDIKSFLNGRRIVASEQSDDSISRTSTQTITPYDTSSRSLLDIVTMITFYDDAGGSSYVGLQHDALSQMELSDTIRLNHAILIGAMSQPLTNLHVDGDVVQPSHSETIVRLILPVDRRPALRNTLPESL